jgi:phage nucleotide-binding protein
MAIQLKSTSNAHVNGVKIVVYGQAGAGKTSLIKTLPKPLIISAEGGLLSLSGTDIPYIEISNYSDLTEAYQYCVSEEANQFETIAIDSISEIAEVILTHEKQVNKDGRAAYGEMTNQVMGLMRSFRDISGKNIYFSAKCEKQQDESGRMLYSPSMPGSKLGQSIPYLVDEVMALRTEKDQEGVTQRALMCESDGLWQAKDRSGKLSPWEAPDLGAIIKKIGGQE